MSILDFIFPKKCLGCGVVGKYICGKCLKKTRPGGYDGKHISIFKYEGVIKKAITAIKYQFAYDIAWELSDIIIERIKNYNLRFKNITLIPIPLHKLRQNWRGFNQAEIIGERIASQMGWKFIPDLLIRTKNTLQQAGLERNSRLKNLSGVFVVNPNFVSGIKYPVLIFDDVYTTGTTINEAKKTLQKAGFKNICSLTIARG